MNQSSALTSSPRLNKKQAHKLIHGLWKQNADAMYHRRDMKLRIIAVAGVVAMLIGLGVGDMQGLPLVQAASLVAGVLVFGGALWTASRNYKTDFNRFVVAHMADDGTFLYCPECQALMGDPNDEHVRTNPPTSCTECGSKPWKFERPK
ncbi:hypothetical protein [Algisphaera agarilytica]|uniref:Uncharacterized protein YjeT (DUF2065 family) n=1 Tax=Algisphaera agarilytica TaxID=1385975 RepID=A0A7X0H3H2_9BACT|nr:hypothetical protein [Algisphaera agarilytica]MBB6428603.1 uncharacterized protein YjeT (DUF2065 family) [Algisphaera agarilytica]